MIDSTLPAMTQPETGVIDLLRGSKLSQDPALEHVNIFIRKVIKHGSLYYAFPV